MSYYRVEVVTLRESWLMENIRFDERLYYYFKLQDMDPIYIIFEGQENISVLSVCQIFNFRIHILRIFKLKNSRSFHHIILILIVATPHLELHDILTMPLALPPSMPRLSQL